MSAPLRPTAGRAGTSTRPNGRFTLRRAPHPDDQIDEQLDAAGADDVADDIANDDGVDWRAVGTFGAGLFLGALIGASTALLLAPASGFETRMRLVRDARRAGEHVAGRWEDASDRVRGSAQRSRRKLQRDLERKLTMARWRARDAWERKRYGA